ATTVILTLSLHDALPILFLTKGGPITNETNAIGITIGYRETELSIRIRNQCVPFIDKEHLQSVIQGLLGSIPPLGSRPPSLDDEIGRATRLNSSHVAISY